MTAPMSITDELRKYAADNDAIYMTSFAAKCLIGIADRIDAEHTRRIDVLHRDMSDAEWVRLPVDADGVPIRFGDKVTVSWSEKVYEVRGFSYTERLASGERTIWVDVYSLEKMGNIPLCGANSCHHYHEPTVEDVLREFGDWYAHTKGGCDEDGIIAEYASKLSLAGDGKER